ncbi:MAG: TIR domain-containing protein [Bacteroidota bacterium]
MKRRNYFISYHHSSDLKYLKALRKKFQEKKFNDYGFKEEDLGEASKRFISKKIQSRLWSSSITIVLVGEQTGSSAWIDWEIWYSLQSYRSKKVTRRQFKPKGLLAIFLPVEIHHIPSRLQANLDSGYAVAIQWNDLLEEFDAKIEESYQNRSQTDLIRNKQPLMDNPRTPFNYLSLSGLFRTLRSKLDQSKSPKSS